VTPPGSDGSALRAVIIVCAFDCYPYLTVCLASIRAQDYPNVTVVVVDDASPDERQRAAVRSVNQWENWTGVLNDTNVGSVANIWHAVHDHAPGAPDDVIIIVDGDDALHDSRAVSTIMAAYDADPNCWVTYGSYVSVPHRDDCPVAIPYHPDIVASRSFRSHSTLFNHPETMARFVFDAIDESDLRLASGDWVPYLWDEAYMYPALELAGPNHRWLPDCLYDYHSDTGNNCVADPERTAVMRAVGIELRARPRKPCLIPGWVDRPEGE
jgi:glycosyltransferase involved in cell wall biosynthesis